MPSLLRRPLLATTGSFDSGHPFDDASPHQPRRAGPARQAAPYRTVAILALVLTGCLEIDPPLETETDEITNANQSIEAPEVVKLVFPGSVCTGVVVSQNWIMTAAHCIAGQPTYGLARLRVIRYSGSNVQTQVYPESGSFGRTSYYVHPDFDDPILSGNVHDIGLIRLYDGGMHFYTAGRFYVDNREPWDTGSAESASVTTFGVGLGSNAGGPVDCDSSGLSLGLKRKGVNFSLYRTGLSGLQPKMAVSMNGQHMCGGDSGGAWTLLRGGLYMTFALHSYHTEDYWYDDAFASATRYHFQWVQNTASEKGIPLICPLHTSGGYEFRVCHE